MDFFHKIYYLCHSYLLLCLLLLKLPKCYKGIMLDATQEGSLHPFKNYKDVTMFHYTVPKEVLRATWQFAAFMDDKQCPPRKVHIYLQWGSYPIISQNSSYPSNMYTERKYQNIVTTITEYQANAMVILPIYSPQPGDWFVGAYMPYWDEKVHQQGLGHKCQYSIGSIATWTQVNRVQNIPIGYSTTIRTTQTESYYKIYIPSNVWAFDMHIWSCNFTLRKSRNVNESCIKSMALQGRSLPVLNHTHPAGNLTMNDFYTFSELTPYEDSYYYLLVVSNSIIDFKVKVNTIECPVENVGKTSSLGQSYIRDYNYIEKEKCPLRYQLSRIEHSEMFSKGYLLKGTNWIVLSDLNPTIVQFKIMPLVDTGGTLGIDAYLDSDKSFTQQLIVVNACVRRGRTPARIKGQIVCESNNLMVNLSSDKQSESLLIPYPQPDMWYITLQVKCYANSKPIRCEMKKIPISLDVKLRKCIYPGNYSCGLYGACQHVQQGALHYTSCNCFGGYKGWGCTDDSSVNFQTSALLMTILLTASNVFFLPATYVAIKRGFYAEGLVYFSTMLFSSFYHACDQQFTTYCAAKYEVLQYTDFFASTLSFWVTVIAMAELPVQYSSLCHMFGVILIAYGVQSDKTGLSNILVLLIAGICILIFSYTRYCFKVKTRNNSKRVTSLIVGFTFVGLGLILFCVIETEANYYYIHSVWHVTIAASLIFLLPPIREEQYLQKVGKVRNTDNVMIQKHTSTKASTISLASLTSPVAVLTVINAQDSVVTQTTPTL